MRVARDRGSMGLFAAILAPALFLCVMVFTNAAVKWNAWRDASDAADAAARAAAQPSVDDYAGDRLVLGGAARARAQAVISASGYAGEVQIDGKRVVVTISADVDYVFPAVGLGSSVAATGDAVLTVTGE